MTKSVDDYLTEGIYGVRLPKEEERIRFLGTLRERIIVVLTTGQVMSNSAIDELEEAMKQHPKARLILNGHIAYRFLKEEKELADKYNIPYTAVTNEETKTEIGAVLTYDYAINKEEIYITDEPKQEVERGEKETTFLSNLMNWFK